MLRKGNASGVGSARGNFILWLPLSETQSLITTKIVTGTVPPLTNELPGVAANDGEWQGRGEERTVLTDWLNLCERDC